MVLGLYATREGTTVYVGRGSEAAMKFAAGQWEAKGWSCERRPGRPQNLRDPFDPVECPECGWAGMNLATHWPRAHKGKPVPDIPLTAAALRERNKRTRARAELAKAPRAGQLVVHQRTDLDVDVFRIDQVVENGAILKRLAGRISVGVKFEVDLEDLLDHYLPVCRWGRG